MKGECQKYQRRVQDAIEEYYGQWCRKRQIDQEVSELRYYHYQGTKEGRSLLYLRLFQYYDLVYMLIDLY